MPHKNTVELLGYYGNDQIHACSAWTSTSRDLNEEKINRIPQLLKMLASSGHETPFEKSSLHFLVDCDIASHIHLIKHRIGVSVNAESARYKELKEDKFYLPDDWPQHLKLKLKNITKQNLKIYHEVLKELQAEGIDKKRAKESARFFRPYNTKICSDVMFNFRSFVHFLRLRNTEHAQKEIREIAAEMLRLVKEIEGNPFKNTIEAFGL